jgi:hypothetical protein
LKVENRGPGVVYGRDIPGGVVIKRSGELHPVGEND